MTSIFNYRYISILIIIVLTEVKAQIITIWTDYGMHNALCTFVMLGQAIVIVYKLRISKYMHICRNISSLIYCPSRAMSKLF